MIARLGLGKFKIDTIPVECQTDFELVDKAEYDEKELSLIQAEAKVTKIEHENLKQAKAIELD